MQRRRVNFHTLGCKLNFSESSTLAREFEAGGFIRVGYHEEVDRLRHIMNGGKGVLAEIEAKEKERTGIRTLKIGYNKVFGYYIEVSNSFKDQVPDTYIRKQIGRASCRERV